MTYSLKELRTFAFYYLDVYGLVTDREMKALTKELEKRYGITENLRETVKQFLTDTMYDM